MQMPSIYCQIFFYTLCAFTPLSICIASPESPTPNTAIKDSKQTWIPSWKSAPPMSRKRTGHSTLVINNHLYVVGGTNKDSYFKINEYAQIAPDGSLSNWTDSEHHLNVGRAFHGVTKVGRYIYAVGGSRTNVEGLLDIVERAEINSDGSIGKWTLEKHKLNIARRCVHVTSINGYLYAVGGFGGKLLDTVERAKIMEDGILGEWEMLTDTMQKQRYVHGVKAIGNRLYVLGGHDQEKGIGISSVEWTQQDKEGLFDPWKMTAKMQQNRYGLEVVAQGNYIYSMGGIDGIMHLSSIEKGRIDKDSGITDWQYTTSLPNGRASFGSAVHNNAVYIVGGSTGETLTNQVSYAFFNQQGDIGYWGLKDEAATIAQKKNRLLRKIQHQYPEKAKIIEYLKAGQIDFLNVQRKDGMTAWLAVPAGGFYQTGMFIRFASGTTMAGYYNTTLQRRFRIVMFVKDMLPVEEVE